ncbi:alpha/beta fold hydrolase [Sphingomonas sp. DT-204]|uniref:alpha/beta hydrolase n=1 Tax=Sphingomonas sp. DT-204 TaxID=3396166 RepID=UPI003F1B67A0
MKRNIALRALTSALALAMAAPLAVHAQPVTMTVASNPLELKGDGMTLRGEEGYVAVRENRRDPNSRVILVNYLRVFSQSGGKRDPIFLLPGGPGDLTDRRDFAKPWYPKNEFRKLVTRFTRNRDLVVVNQRGNFYVLGPNGMFEAPPPDDRNKSPTPLIAEWKGVLKTTFDKLKARGVDLSGYDFPNMVEDVDDVRAALGYEKIIPYGFSFGSQLGFGYIRMHEDRVARALFGGVEPLDYGYDSADALWAALMRIAERAEASPIAAQLPPGGLGKAVQTILARLRAKPVTVTVADPDSGKPTAVEVNAEDFQAVLTDPVRPFRGVPLSTDTRIWPKMVTEVYNGDYRYIALRKLFGFIGFTGTINLPLIDHSLGVSAARDRELLAEKANDILGDPNIYYRVWADIMPTPVIGDDIRLARPINVPVVLLQGDVDMQTPYENAVHQAQFLRNGVMIRAINGTHHVEYEVETHDPVLSEKLERFVDLDLQPNPDVKALLASFPKEITLPVEFEPPQSTPLYERPQPK